MSLHVDHNYLDMTLKHISVLKNGGYKLNPGEDYSFQNSLLAYVVFGHSEYKGKQKEIVEAAVRGELSQLSQPKCVSDISLCAQEPMSLC